MMAKPKNEQHEEDEAVIMERMNKALKVMMSTPPETHEQMVKRRREAQRPTRTRKPNR